MRSQNMRLQDMRFQIWSALVAAVLLTPAAFLPALLAEVTQCTVTGTVTVEVAQDSGQGQWTVIDRARVSANVIASLTDLAGGLEARSDTTWSGISEQGRSLTVRWLSPAHATVDPHSGSVVMDVTLDVSIDGARVTVPTHLTTETVSSPLGPQHGRRGTVANHVLSAEAVAVQTVRAPDQIAALTGAGRGGRAGAGETGAANAHVLVLVIHADGRAVRTGASD